MHRLTPAKLMAPGLLALSLALSACGGGTGTLPQAGTSPGGAAGSETVSLTLRAPFAAQAAPLGLPGGTGGRGPVDFLKVRVYDGSKNLVTFDGRNVYAKGGAQSFLTLDADHPTVKVVLPRGQYSFENIGKTAENGEFLAYGWNRGADLSGQNPGVDLTLHTLLDPPALRLSSATPVNFVAGGDVLDLRLTVPTPTEGGTRHSVPLGDYEVSYSAPQGEVLSSSKLGARVRVGGDAGAFAVEATVTGWRATGLESAAQEPTTLRFELPLSTGGVGADLEAPALTFAPVTGAQQGREVTLSGTASDTGAGVASVQVYDGPTLIGREGGTGGVAPVEFATDAGGRATGAWTLRWTPDVAGSRDLTVVATDLRGNESRRTQTVAVAAPPRSPYDELFTLTEAVPSHSASRVVESGGEYWVKVDATALTAGQITLDVEVWADSMPDLTVTYGPTREGATLPLEAAGGFYFVQATAPGTYWLRVGNKTNQPVQVIASAY